MGRGPIEVSTIEELEEFSKTLEKSEQQTISSIYNLLKNKSPLSNMKFDKIGCHPLDPSYEQNLIEQISLQATYRVAIDATKYLMERHQGKKWVLAPGPYGSGPDIKSVDDKIVAEVFSAVHEDNNQKSAKDLARMFESNAEKKYVFCRVGNVKEFKEVDIPVGNITKVYFAHEK